MLHTEDRICEFCGKTFKTTLKDSRRFCSTKCQSEWQKTRVGELSPHYSRIKTRCDWCGKEFSVKRSKKDASRHFCSTECRREWFAKVWSQSEGTKNASRERAVKLLTSGVTQQTQSAPQKSVNEMLREMGICFVNEKAYNGYSMDNYLTDYDLYIEVMGDFWHCSPLAYKEPQNDIQRTIVERDSRKMKRARGNGDYVLYLWERDVMRQRDLCEKLIKMFISQKGVLPDYHSFNYILENGSIQFHKVATPFQERMKAA